MAAYMICTMKVHDPETFRKYSDHTPGTLKQYGGRFLTRGDQVTTSEGEAFGERMVILEFPDRAAAEAWYNDEEYQRLSQFRRAATSNGRMILQEGRPDQVSPDPRV
ncbi:MAG: DUF1330 domain-containing protein [Pseudomonadota bacterium]|nr:DUF1330 domain-containing protein [Pseudomonadota bacterium]